LPRPGTRCSSRGRRCRRRGAGGAGPRPCGSRRASASTPAVAVCERSSV
jgi:hypothetical protein